jgi:hypothetical protein
MRVKPAKVGPEKPVFDKFNPSSRARFLGVPFNTIATLAKVVNQSA